MPKTLDQVLAEDYTPEQLAEIDRWVAKEREQIMLRELRKLLGVTQAELAKRAGTAQAEISTMERREDWLFSTLRRYIEALGGQLEVRAVFGDRSLHLRLLREERVVSAKRDKSKARSTKRREVSRQKSAR